MKFASPIQVFLTASIAVHGGLLAVSDTYDLTLPGSTGSVITVKIQENTQHKSFTVPQPVQNKIKSPTTEKRTVHQNKNKNKEHIAKHLKENYQVQSTTSQSNAETKAHVISVVYSELTNHFSYPKIAQRRNWQGQVLLAFHIDSNGSIKNIKINHSSGYSVLDQAAIVSLKKIGQLPHLKSWLHSGMEIQIPIVYQLTKG